MQIKKFTVNTKAPGLSGLAGRRILFANFPSDGHFNPLTGLAMHLKELGCEVRWYTSKTYTGKLKKLKIPHYPFEAAMDVSNNDFDSAFPGRTKCRTQLGRLKFDMINAFIRRAPEYYSDIANIYRKFPFELMVADVAFTAIPFVKEKLGVPVISIGVFPLSETSKDLPPAGLGMMPSTGYAGRMMQSVLRGLSNTIFFRQPNRIMHALLDESGIPHCGENVFDMLIKKSDLLLQSGVPGFEYYRGDMGSNIRFIGSLLPYHAGEAQDQWFDKRLNQYLKIVLVTQGTVEKNAEKIIVPALEAFKNSDTLVIATTGGSQTQALRERYPYRNIIIEDFIPFADVMPYADVYITNGGYGGVMLGIENTLPMVVAGVHEGKNEINARVGYFNLGVNLKTERPTPAQVKAAAEEVFNNPLYKENVVRLGKEFNQYNACTLGAEYVNALLNPVFSRLRVRQTGSN